MGKAVAPPPPGYATAPMIQFSQNINFTGAFPPTHEDVLLQFYGCHNYPQTESNFQSFVTIGGQVNAKR